MGSQFVDLNRDGHLDYLTATFDGSPHVAWGSAEGFLEPVRLKDAEGRRILVSSFWNYEAEQHQTTGRAMPDGKPVNERCISALAFDWDGDGDRDLLLGSYESGHLYRQMNEGTDAEPKFTGRNLPVMAGDVPFALPAKMTAPRLVDWDGDGDLDLLAGSFGEPYTHEGEGGGVYLSLDLGKAGAPRFGPLTTLIPPSRKGHTAPTRPDAGLYVDAVDWDGDGDLDLVVGGYSMWTPAPRELSAEERARVAALKQEVEVRTATRQEVLTKRNQELVKATAGLDRKDPALREKRAAILAKHEEAFTAASEALREVTEALHALVPRPERRSFVWLYERL